MPDHKHIYNNKSLCIALTYGVSWSLLWFVFWQSIIHTKITSSSWGCWLEVQKKIIEISDLWLKTCANTTGVIGFWDQCSWRVARGTDAQSEAFLKENICQFLIEGLRASCPCWGSSQLDLGNWLHWECWEDRWGQEEQVVPVETCEVLEVLPVPLICPSTLIPHRITAHAGTTDSEK